MPVTGADDIRNLMPAVGADVAAQLAAPFAQIEQQLTSAIPNLESLVEGVDFGVAAVPDLTKVIPGLDAFGGLGAQVSGALGGLESQVSGALGGLGDLENQARAAASQAQSALNTAANQGIAAASNAATSRVRSLLG